MGTQSSNSKDDNIMNDKTEDPSMQWNEISSYKGMKSDTSSTKNNKNNKKNLNQESSSSNSSSIDTKTKEETTISKKDERIPFKFEWKEGGNKVTITGSFLSNWTVFIEMVKNPENGNFEFNMNLPKSKHQFKFIVDNVWKCSNNYPILNDGSGNFNNVIDLTNFVIQDEENNSNQNENVNNKENEKEKKEKKIKNKNEYNCYIPNKNEMNIDAPFIPPHYINFYDIDYNTKQNVIGKKKYLHFVEKDILSENSCYKNILSCPHVNLNHCCNCCKAGSDDKYIRSCTSQRYKHKLMTIIYYKPKKKNEL